MLETKCLYRGIGSTAEFPVDSEFVVKYNYKINSQGILSFLSFYILYASTNVTI